MKEQIDRIEAALPVMEVSPSVRCKIATVLWIGCEYGSGNAIVGLVSESLLNRRFLNLVADALHLTDWTGGAGWHGCMQLLECHSSYPDVDALLRKLDQASTCAVGTPEEL